MAISSSKGFKKITAVSWSLKHQLPAFLLVAASCILSYVYFDKYHKKGDLKYAYLYKKNIRPYVAGYDKVYTKSLDSDLDCYEILSASLKLRGIDHPIEIEKDLKEYDFTSAIIISTERLGNFKVVDSTAEFDGKPVLVIDPNK